MLRFTWWWAALLFPLPLFVYWFMPPAPEEHHVALRVPFFSEITNLGTHGHGTPRSRMYLVLMAAWLLLLLAAARPQWVADPVGVTVSGRDLMLAVDISGSMKTQDLQMGGEYLSRLQVVKHVAGDFIERREGDRIGLILFGTRAYLQTPLTFDRRTVRTLLDESEIGLAGERTAIGDAIGLAVKRLKQRDTPHRVLILLTDGANTAGVIAPLRAAELAAATGLRIYTIGVAADELIVRDFLGTRRVNPAADLDESTLNHIAETTGGRYFRARETETLTKIYGLLDELEPIAAEDEYLRPVSELFMYPLALVMMLALWLLIRETESVTRLDHPSRRSPAVAGRHM